MAWRWLLTSHVASSVAQSMVGVPAVAYVYDRTASSGWAGAATAAAVAPYVLFSGPAGALGDFLDRRLVLLAADALRIAVVVTAAVGVALSISPLLAVALTFLATSAGTAYYPALAAATPSYVEPIELARANARVAGIDSAAYVVGPGVSGALVVLAGPEAAFAAAAAVFLTSCACLLRAATPSVPSRASATRPDLLTMMVEAVEGIRRSATAPVTTLVLVITEMMWGFAMVLLVLLADETLGSGTDGYGLLHLAIGVGAVLAIFTADRTVSRLGSRATFVASIVATGAPFVVATSLSHGLVIYPLMALAGLATTLVEVLLRTELHRSVDPAIHARTFGFMDSMASIAILVGAVAAPMLVSLAGLQTSLLVTGAALPLVAVISAARWGLFSPECLPDASTSAMTLERQLP